MPTHLKQAMLGMIFLVLIILTSGCMKKSTRPISAPTTITLDFETSLGALRSGFLLQNTDELFNPLCASTVSVIAHVTNPGPDTVGLALYAWLWYVYRDSSGGPDWTHEDRLLLVLDSTDCPAIPLGLGDHSIALGEVSSGSLDSTSFAGFTLYLQLASSTPDASVDPHCVWNQFPHSSNDSVVVHGCDVVFTPINPYVKCPPDVLFPDPE